jgi:pimeloyl-ACP methyl ester carboxylesterase
VAYEQLLAEARRQENKQALAELQANGPPPYASISKAMVHTKWANRFEPGQLSTLALLSTVLFDSEANVTDLVNYAKGISTSQDHFREAVETEDLPSLGTTFEMPFFVFQGALDNVTPVEPVREYVSMISAPTKEFVLVPNGGHNVVATRSDDFLALLRRYVRPVVVRSR